MLRVCKTATVMNDEKVEVGDKVVKTNENATIAFQGNVISIYRYGARTYLTVQTKHKTIDILSNNVRKVH